MENNGPNAQQRGTKYALLAAEPSGDLQAAALAQQILAQDPSAVLVGIGGRNLRDAGVELLMDTSAWGTIGPFEVIGSLPGIIRAYFALQRALLKHRPDMIVMIDSPALFMRLARFARAQGLRTVYYFPPSAWSDSERRAQSISARVDGVVCAFERQYETYRRAGASAQYYGHPMVDVVKPWAREQALESLGLPEGRYLCLLPGSRLHEVRIMTPIFVAAAQRLAQEHSNLTFLLPAASEAVYEKLQVLLQGTDVMLFHGQAQESMAVSEVAILASGSVTLEAAYLDCPFVLAYRLNPLDALFARILVRLGLLRLPRFSLPNLVLDEDAIPELFQEEVHCDRLVAETKRLLHGGPGREAMLEILGRTREKLGRAPVVALVASYVVGLARGVV